MQEIRSQGSMCIGVREVEKKILVLKIIWKFIKRSKSVFKRNVEGVSRDEGRRV